MKLYSVHLCGPECIDVEVVASSRWEAELTALSTYLDHQSARTQSEWDNVAQDWIDFAQSNGKRRNHEE